MQSLPQSTPPPWDESESFRETTLYLLDDPADREAVRHAGRVLHDLALEATRDPGVESATREELRAAAVSARRLKSPPCCTLISPPSARRRDERRDRIGDAQRGIVPS
jgi:hypothetical protein